MTPLDKAAGSPNAARRVLPDEFAKYAHVSTWTPTGNVRMSADFLGYLVIRVEEERWRRVLFRHGYSPARRRETRWRMARPHHVRFIEFLYAALRADAQSPQ